MRTSEALDEHKGGVLSKAVHELNKEGNKAADTVRSLEHRLQVQYTEISSQSYDCEHSQRQQEILVADVRDRDEAHQEHLAQMKREKNFSSNSLATMSLQHKDVTGWSRSARGNHGGCDDPDKKLRVTQLHFYRS